MAQHIKPEPKAMSLKTERAHTEPCTMKGKRKKIHTKISHRSEFLEYYR